MQPRKTNPTISGTCGVCLQVQALRSGKLVLHGYRRPGYGHTEGRCRGVGTVPYELSVESCAAEQHRLQEKLADVNALIDKIDRGQLETVQRWRLALKRWVLTSRTDVSEGEWSDLVRYYRNELTSQQRRLDTDLVIQTRLVRAWQLRPLPGEEGYTSVQSILFHTLATTAARKSERRTANPSWWGLDETGHHTEPAEPTTQVSIQEVLDEFEDLVGIACSDGNWNYDPYLRGMANGMLLMRSVLSGEEPKYLDAPAAWLSDHPSSGPAMEYQAGFREAQVLLADTRRKAAVPREQDLQKTYYHGTPSKKAARSIATEGIKAPVLKSTRGYTTPVPGRVYLTHDIAYAQRYALGANYAGYVLPESFMAGNDRFGYVFVIDGNTLRDIQPDEDSVGELLGSKKAPAWLLSLAHKTVAPDRLSKAMNGEYPTVSSVGKQLLRVMSEQEKLDLLDLGLAISHGGSLLPSACWRLDKKRSQDLKQDGSNFFTVAEPCDFTGQQRVTRRGAIIRRAALPKPTAEMIRFFKIRTAEHIRRVYKYLLDLDGLGDFSRAELTSRGKAHDEDKYSTTKALPYVWVTEYYRVKNSGEKVSEELKRIYEQTRKATGDHVTLNRHHPEAHSDLNAMTDLDTAEMVADWSAMAEELGEGSARGWAEANVPSKWKFDQDHIDLIYHFIDSLEA
jgi:hypothetical protein